MGTTVDAPPRAKTQYVVLVLDTDADGTHRWMQIGEKVTFEGNTDIDAIKAATQAMGVDEGSFVAVPARSFKARTIEVRTHRSVSIS